METVKIISADSITYIIQYEPSRPNKKGVWQVKKITENGNETKIEIADMGNNSGKTIDDVMVEYETLNYNYIQEL